MRWKTDGDSKNFAKANIVSVDLSASDKTTLKLSLIVPRLSVASDSASKNAYALSPFHLVPLADVRILILNQGAVQPVAVDTVIGITHPLFALIAVVTVFVLIFGWLWYVVTHRLHRAGIPKVNPLLTVITTPSGYASLSQFQIILCTLILLGFPAPQRSARRFMAKPRRARRKSPPLPATPTTPSRYGPT